jgi:hypothetical protein
MVKLLRSREDTGLPRLGGVVDLLVLKRGDEQVFHERHPSPSLLTSSMQRASEGVRAGLRKNGWAAIERQCVLGVDLRRSDADGMIVIPYPRPGMPETADAFPERPSDAELPASSAGLRKKDVTWKDVDEETKRQVYLLLLEHARERRLRGELRCDDDLPPPIDDREPAPPVDLNALARLASDEDMPQDEIDRLYALIDAHRSWYDAYERIRR